jgi:general secretion pathway protein E
MEAILDGENLPIPKHFFEPVGCEECKHTGYSGRLCVYELVKIDDSIKSIIHQQVEVAELREKTRGKYVSIRVNGARKIAEGETSVDEILKVIY